MEDFEKLYMDHKQLEAEYKKLGPDYDRHQEKIKEAWMELKEKTEALAEQQKVMVASMVKVLEEAAKERMELTSKHHEEVERAKTVLDRLLITYQTELM